MEVFCTTIKIIVSCGGIPEVMTRTRIQFQPGCSKPRALVKHFDRMAEEKAVIFSHRDTQFKSVTDLLDILGEHNPMAAGTGLEKTGLIQNRIEYVQFLSKSIS